MHAKNYNEPVYRKDIDEVTIFGEEPHPEKDSTVKHTASEQSSEINSERSSEMNSETSEIKSERSNDMNSERPSEINSEQSS